MARHDLSAVVRYLQQLAGSSGASGASDAELLERYVRYRDESAFELLLWRHGALVFNVCRRLLPCTQDAEDAFQATFLALMRKAGSISRRDSVASWLYKVAYRVALEAKERTRRTATVEKSGAEMLAVQQADDPLWSDLRPVLDEELNRLPEHLRLPIVLCYLEGKSNAEAARELGCRLGTIYSRLSRGRELLRQRLERRGVALPIAALTAALTWRAAEAAPAISLMRGAARAALAFADPSSATAVSPRVATLAEGVLRTMFVTKLKIAAVMLLVVSLAAGGVLTYGRTAAPQAEAKAENPPPKPAGGDKKDTEPIAVKVTKPKKGRLPQTFFASTFAEPVQRQQLGSLVSGTISEVAVDIGDSVKKGQVLIRLDAPLLAKDVEEAEATLQLAQAQVDEARAKAAAVENQIRKSLADNFNLAQAKASLNAATAKLKLAKVALDKAKIQESFTRLCAQFDGVVAERNCDPGNLVQSGTNGAQKPLLTLVRVDRLRVLVDLDPVSARFVERGDPVELNVNGIKNYGAGKIAGISPIVDRRVGRGEGIIDEGRRAAIIDVDNPNNRLVPGEVIIVKISCKRTHAPDTLIVPSQCVVGADDQDDNEPHVFVVRDGKAHRTPVRVSIIDEKNAEIVEGIKTSDLVITNNQKKLRDGTPVKIEKGS